MKVYTYNDKVLVNSANDKWLKAKETPVDPYNPLGLPAKTFRFQLRDGQSWAGAMTPTVVSEGIIDVTFTGSDLTQWNKDCISRVLGGNATDFTSLAHLFEGCSYITEFPLIDTSNVTDMTNMFNYCSALISVPLLNTSSVTNMNSMFFNCTNVESGALALYQQASTQATPPIYHEATFEYCGSNTVTGAAELAQIPTSWGGKQHNK